MILVLKVLAAVVLVVLATVVTLRVRKLRRDQARELARTAERRLMTPPPSPYTPSKGFRLLDGHEPGTVRPSPSRPRLDPERHYVFSESTPSSTEEVVPNLSRHDQEWLLHRSSSRSSLVGVGPITLIVLVVVFVVAAVVLYARHHHGPVTTTTTTTITKSTTTTAHSLGRVANVYFALDAAPYPRASF
ncbi:MAG TPA: hypothetical protein PLG60_04400 [Acidimicrobiales bacterium]|nr:MAG: hypothetical protein B7X07_06565 [Actinobacteria bacterium 21-64-8]HQT99724.1 hypothetical protein [Acidimicrobiales bacterium]